MGPNHRSFSRILPDSSNFPGAIPKFISKFDVRMNYHQSYSFSKIFQILFIIGSNFLIFIPEYLNNSWWCFSLSFSNFEDRRRVPLKSLPVLPKIHGSSFIPSSHNCFRLWEFFSPIRSISWVVSISFLRRPSGHNSSFSACSYRSPNLTGASFK